MSNNKDLKQRFLAVAEMACNHYHLFVHPDARRCPDAYFGTVCSMLPKPEIVRHQIPRNRVVLIVESPHTDEFKENEVWPIQGTSGDNVRRFMRTLLPSALHEWGLFVVNAICYQCSQGLILDKGSNRSAKNFVVGNLLLKESFQNDFVARVNRAIGNATQVFVLNACTKYHAWNVDKSNKELVQELLNGIDSVRGCCFADIRHPVFWTKSIVRTGHDKIENFLKQNCLYGGKE